MSKKKLPKLKNLKHLSLSELEKLYQDLNNYLFEKNENTQKRKEIVAKNRVISENNHKAKVKEIENIEKIAKREIENFYKIQNQLDAMQIGVVGSLFKQVYETRTQQFYDDWHYSAYTEKGLESFESRQLEGWQKLLYGGKASLAENKPFRLPMPEGPKLIEQYKKQFDKVNSLIQRRQTFSHLNLDKETKPPACINSTKKMYISGMYQEVDFDHFSAADVKALIDAKMEDIKTEKSKVDDLKARAAKKETETRSLARKYSKDFNSQKVLLDSCPYCGGELTSNDAHLDHIYPVSKGGQSTQANLVFVCSKCNLTKKDKTLRSFAQGQNYRLEEIYERLDLLKKDF